MGAHTRARTRTCSIRRTDRRTDVLTGKEREMSRTDEFTKDGKYREETCREREPKRERVLKTRMNWNIYVLYINR